MKNIYIVITVLCAVLFTTGCSSDFLDENNDKIKPPAKTIELFLEKSTTNTAKIILDGKTNSSYEIKSFPSNMAFDSFTGSVENGIAIIKYEVDDTDLLGQFGVIELGTIELQVDGLGLVSVSVFYGNYGNPKITVSDNLLDFGKSGDYMQFNIKNNTSDGLLKWEIDSVPEWINVSNSSGLIQTYDYSTIYAICQRGDLPAGDYEGDIIIRNNDKNDSIVTIKVKMTIRATVNPENVLGIEGRVMSAKYSKINDELYIFTQNPNTMIVYNPTTKSMTKLALPKSPNCAVLSEDGKSAYVGYSALMTVIDIKNKKITKSANVDFNVHDIAYGENNWCYMTVKASDSFYGYYAYNLQTNTIGLSTNSNLNANDEFMKIKGKPSLIVANQYGGFKLIDISSGQEGETNYWYSSFGSKLWITEDGSFLIGSNGRIFRTPTSSSSPMFELGKLDGAENIMYLEHNASANSIYTISDYYSSSSVKCYDAGSYYLKKTIAYNNEYYATINGIKNMFEVKPYYIFSNKKGNELYLLRNIISSDTNGDYNTWSIETIK
ncbi:YncE family protein [Dysgonomonas sp. ZJ279]|uniref:YncE family protein n=1 Tax=Dysgonomonas sp. ZJ279 TaxID=2709796 RepID=UPI0013EB6F04|nr:hypothetical protein [Dysgonomonas sp. ZJ279]